MTKPDPPAKPSGGDVLSSLPRTRPQRRSSKRDAAPRAVAKPDQPRSAPSPSVPKSPARKRATAKPTAARAGDARRSQPDAVRPSAATRNARGLTGPPRREADPPTGVKLVGTAVAAAGELAELGVTLGVRSLRNLAGRLPRPK